MPGTTRLSAAATGTGVVLLVIPTLYLLQLERSWSGVGLSVLVISAIWLWALALVDRIGLASLLTGSLLLVIIAAAALKSNLVKQPLLITDFFFLSEQLPANLTILRRYPEMTVKVAISALVMAVAFAALIRTERRTNLGRRFGNVLPRVGAAGAGMLIIPLAVNFDGAGAESSLHDPAGEVREGWQFLAEPGNVMSRLVLSVRTMRVTAPPRRFSGRDTKDNPFVPSDSPGSSGARNATQYPDIIIWHDESTVDPSILEACSVPECRVGLFQPTADTLSAGLLRVHTFGGLSCTAEFALMTGLNSQTFGPGGLYAPFTLAPRIAYSMPRLLRQYGYRTVALYPNVRDFLNAANAYRHYGFDEFYAAEDLRLPTKPSQLTDRVMYQEMARLLEAHRGRPILLYVLTQYQHGPHNQPVERLPEPFRSLRLAGLNSGEQTSLTNYLYRLHLTDEVIADTERTFLRNGHSRKMVFLHYGDHQPSLDGFMPGLAKRGLDHLPAAIRHYVTHFNLKANFPGVSGESHEYLDISLLGSLVLDAADVPKDSFFAANSRLRRLCGGKYLDCPDRDLVDRYHDYIFYDLKALR